MARTLRSSMSWVSDHSSSGFSSVLAMTSRWPLLRSSFSAPRATADQNGLARSPISSPTMVEAAPERSSLAMMLSRKPSWLAAVRTLAAVSSLT